MPIPPPLPEFDPSADPFLELNREAFEQLVTFVDFAADRLTLGFVSVNFARDRDRLLTALKAHPRCWDVQLDVFSFPDPHLRFLRDALLAELPNVPLQPEKKRVLVITGLEYAIGMVGDAPMVLQDLNLVRNTLVTHVPHPILICLPDSALTRLARYAPDFWSWRLAVFRFYTPPVTVDQAMGQTLRSEQLREGLWADAKQERIDLLLRLLNEYDPCSKTIDHLKTRLEILNELGILYRDLGETQKAKDVLQQGLNQAIEDENLSKINSSLLNNMALVSADQGDIDRALQLWQQSLELKERIGDVKGKAATLHNMARVIAQQGDIDRALDLWQQDLEISERIGDVKGKAATLNNMSYLAFQQGDTARALELLRRSAQALGQARAFADLFTVLSNLGVADQERQHAYLAQALWLGLRIQTPLADLINLLRLFFNQVPQGDALEALLATTALYLCQLRGEGHPQIGELQNTSLNMLAGAAVAQGATIQSLDDLTAWMGQQGFNDPAVFLPPLMERLEAMVGERWVFERPGVMGNG